MEAKNKNPLQRTMVLFECEPVDAVDFVNATLAEEVGLGWDSITEGIVAILKKEGLEVYSWTVNGKFNIDKAIDYKLNGIFTDYE